MARFALSRRQPELQRRHGHPAEDHPDPDAVRPETDNPVPLTDAEQAAYQAGWGQGALSVLVRAGLPAEAAHNAATVLAARAPALDTDLVPTGDPLHELAEVYL